MSYIRTISGKNFDIYQLTPDSFDIESISHGLSNTCRFSGQCKRFYSVAEHSCRISIHVYDILTQEGQLNKKEILKASLWGLLHDASEAFLPDMPSPFKKLPELTGFRQLEDKIMAMVAQKFNLPLDMPDIVKQCDSRIIVNESSSLMVGQWPEQDEPLNDDNMPEYGLPPTQAKEWFLEIYEHLTKQLDSYC